MYGNVRSIRNKVDEFAANCKFNRDYSDASLICLTETWLEDKDVDGTVNIDNFNLIRSDRRSTTKKQGGGVCIYVNEKWCKNVTLKDSYCDENVEYMTISCRPFYLPREFSNVYVIIAYVPPSGNYNQAADTLTSCVQNMDNQCPNGVNILLGDFNGCNIDGLLPNYYQFVDCTTRADKTLDLVYCNIKNAYKIVKRQPIGNSDHNMLYCMPKYVQKLKSEDRKCTQIRQWSDEGTDTLRACFECTDWDVLCKETCTLEENVEVCSCYIKFCTDMIIPTKNVTIYPNNKPWVTKHVKSAINKKKFSLSNDRNNIRVVQKELNRTIKDAKVQYKDRIEDLFRTNRTKDAWKGLRCLSGFKSKNCMPDPDDISQYVNELNLFYTRFDDKDFHDEHDRIVNNINMQSHERIVIAENEVLWALSNAKPGKSSGPDKICGRVIKSCRAELVKPMHMLFQLSVDQCLVPCEWKTSEIVPVPKVKIPLVKNDLRPVALTSVIMKCLEAIVKKHICSQLRGLSDQLQFAYRPNRCVEDAVATLLELVCRHLDRPKTYCRTLFIDFSSAFNTIQPHIMLSKLQQMNVNGNLIKWVLSYLTGRKQYVKFNNVTSDIVITNVGAPQGCVLSPLLFTLYTDDCRSHSDKCTVIKYADDTVIIGAIDQNNESWYLKEVESFVNWCDYNYLNLNVRKTKEMIMDFRKDRNEYSLLTIKNEDVDLVHSYKYLGVHVDDQLTFKENIQHVYRKCIQRVHHLRILNNIDVDKTILSLFYKSVIESMLSYCIVVWHGSSRKKDIRKLSKITRIARKMGVSTKNLNELYNERCINMAEKIIRDEAHPLISNYVFLRSGKRLNVPTHRTSRYSRTFIPFSVKLYNHKLSK